MTEKELMLLGELYDSDDDEIYNDFIYAKALLDEINKTTTNEIDHRMNLFKKLFKNTGEKLWIEIPFQCDFGYNIAVGENFYANYDCIIIDACTVEIGDNVFLGPRVSIFTAGHPIDFGVRNKHLEYGKRIQIGDDVWIGGNTVINPGVTIGNNVVIGSGSVVTKDIPSGVIAVGNPCKVLREISVDDKEYWKKAFEKYIQNRRKASL